MKKTITTLSCLGLTSVLLLGCGDADDDAPLNGPVNDPAVVTPEQRDPVGTVTTPPVEDETPGNTVSDLIGGAQDKAADTREQMETMGDEGRQTLQDAAKGLNEGLPAAGENIDVDSIDMSEGASLDESQATAVFDKVRNLISTNSLDTAEQWIAKLDNVKLPAGYDQYLVDAKKLLASARKSVGSVEGMLGK